MIVELHLGGDGRGLREKTGNGSSGVGFRENVRDKSAARVRGLRSDGPDMGFEPQHWMRVGGRQGGGRE